MDDILTEENSPDVGPGDLPALELLEFSLPTIAQNLAFDEALLDQVDAGEAPGWLRLWEMRRYAVVLGRSNRRELEVNAEACERDGVPIARRCSGGGSVVLGPGCLAFSLVLPLTGPIASAGVSTATQWIMRRTAAALASLIDGTNPLDVANGSVEVQGTSDLVSAGRKFSGNSQRWRKHAILHHGTVLYDFDLSRISSYLRSPPREPDYRQQRSHADFVGNFPAPRQAICRALAESWSAEVSDDVSPPVDRVAELVRERYSLADWNE